MCRRGCYSNCDVCGCLQLENTEGQGNEQSQQVRHLQQELYNAEVCQTPSAVRGLSDVIAPAAVVQLIGKLQ